MDALIIDDSRTMRQLLKSIIEPMGFGIFEAGNGLEGLECVTQHTGNFEIVFVDWNMPVMNGVEFVRRVRADTSLPRLNLVMVTAKTEPTQMARALMAGADEFVMEPFTAETLTEKMKLIGVNIPALT